MGKSENKYEQQGQCGWEGKEPGAGWDVSVMIQLNQKGDIQRTSKYLGKSSWLVTKT